MSRLPKLLASGAPEGDLNLHCNLLLTRRCNFECAHCMMVASPKLPGAYMSSEVLGQILNTMEDIKQELVLLGRMHEGTVVTYNLVGGEPTLDMDHFARCVDYLVRSGVRMEMTTNGWWLRSVETLTQFMRAVRPWYYAGDESIIRISDSPYHASFRMPMELAVLELWRGQGVEPDGQEIIDLLTSSEDLPSGCECPECGVWVSEDDFDEHTQDSCSVSITALHETRYDEADRRRNDSIPEQFQNQFIEMLKSGASLGIFVDNQLSEGQQISPVGRAKNSAISAWQDGPCGKHTHEVKFTFQPDGSVYDFCCNGGKVAGGHARDGSQLLYNHMDFMSLLFEHYPVRDDPKIWGWHNPWQGERCRGCSHVARQWREREDKILRNLKLKPKTVRKRKLQPA